MKNNNYNQNNNNYKKGMTTQRINIGAIYTRLQQAIANRNHYQAEMNRLKYYIGHYKVNKSAEIDRLTQKLGSCTHEINLLISQLCQYKKTHRAMNLAYDYLSREIDRNIMICQKNVELIKDVKSGRRSLVYSTGVVTYDYKPLLKYVEKKMEQLKKQRKWLEYVKRYREVR